jgi:hypothetical protein
MPGGVDAEAFGEASLDCARSAGAKGQSDADTQKWAREYKAVEDCIRDNGYADFPRQEEGVLDLTAPPNVDQKEFDVVVDACFAEHSPDTQMQSTDVGPS